MSWTLAIAAALPLTSAPAAAQTADPDSAATDAGKRRKTPRPRPTKMLSR